MQLRVCHLPRNVAGMASTDAAAQELLRDAFTRLIEHVDELTDGLTDQLACYRPTPSANSIAWLLWHSARVQDIQVAHVAGVEEVWTRDGWVDRFGLDLPRHDTGYGHRPEDVAKVRAPADLLSGYYHAVHKLTLEYIAGMTADELSRVVDTSWNPPVTVSARLVSIVDDCAQHLGQAAYLRGIAAITATSAGSLRRWSATPKIACTDGYLTLAGSAALVVPGVFVAMLGTIVAPRLR